MHQFDHASKLAILERWEHTHFLQFSSADSSLLDVAMEHSKVDLVIPKDLPALNKVFEKAFEKVFKINLKSNGIEFFILKSNDIEFYKIYKILIEYRSFVQELLNINRYFELVSHSYVRHEYVRLHDDRIGSLWSHSRTFPMDDKATKFTQIDLMNGETEGSFLLRMDIVSPPLALQAEWKRVEREYFAKPGFSEEGKRLRSEGEQLKKEIRRRYLDTLPSARWISLDESSIVKSAQLMDLAQRPEELAQRVEHALAEHDYALANDGKYRVRLLTDLQRYKPGILVEYTPRTYVPPFVECLTVAKRRLPRAFHKPLITNVHRSDRTFPRVTRIDSSPWSELDNLETPLVTEELLNAIEADTEAREQARKAISVKGTEALGWYQSFHKYDESVWGIYLDDFTISHVALDLRDRLAEADANGYADYAKALRAIIWLVAAHEWFHAQVDAAALLRELASSKPCFRAYFRHVYQQTIHHPTALEEALANYEALRFVQQRLQELVALEQWTEEERAISLQFVQDLFDASPPGYADFRKGADYLNRRLLATQVFDGRLHPDEPLPPVEGLLADIPGMVFQKADIPIYMTYRTPLADALTWCPPRRLAEQALRRKGFKQDKARGKGSHELWKAEDGRTFPLPRRDPLSIGVYTNLCRLLGTNKREFQSLSSA
jgi:hypothetical protein